MTNLFKKATLSVALGASAIVASVPAQAQWRGGYDRYDRYDRNRGDRGGAAIVAGIAGLAIGAAIASSNRNDRRFAYDTRFYDQRGYYPNDGYYARNYNNNRGWNGYNRGGFNGGYYAQGYNRCVVRRVYDPYIGRNVRVRYC